MKKVFADTLYWIAISRPDDPWRENALKVEKIIGKAQILTTDEVLSEFLTALSGSSYTRETAALMVKAILNNAGVKVVPQSHESFLNGFELYEKRPDKKYSMTDCISMKVINNEAITEVLTYDRHFEQEGFNALMSKK